MDSTHVPKSGQEPPEYLTLPEVATLLRVSPKTARKWAAQGLLRHYRISARGGLRFTRAAVDEFMASRTEAGLSRVDLPTPA